MTTDTVRWGVLSTAGISESLIPGLLAAEGSELAGIASRSAGRAEAAAARWGCRAYPSYEQLLDDPSIEAVYIPLPNHLHAEWTVRALEAGKHVLCEKPLALTLDEVDTIAAAAQRTGRHVLEAFMYRHAPRWQRAVSLVASGAIGEPRVVRVGFAFWVPLDLANIRFIPEVGGGIIWDMGCYAANMARGVLGREPVEVFGFPDVREGQPAETTFTGVMRFGPMVNAPFWVSFDFHNPFAQVEVVGSDGLADAARDGVPPGAIHPPAPPPVRRGDRTWTAWSRWSRRSPSWTPTAWRSSTWPTPSGAALRWRTAWTTRGPTPQSCSPCTRRG